MVTGACLSDDPSDQHPGATIPHCVGREWDSWSWTRVTLEWIGLAGSQCSSALRPTVETTSRPVHERVVLSNAMNQPAATRSGGSACRHGVPPFAAVRSESDGCFVEGCAQDVEWAGWWYRDDGARHLTESCCDHSDHHDFTPVTRFAAATDVHGRCVG